MLNLDELAILWFDYNDYSFVKTEKILKYFSKAEDIFNKDIVSNITFENYNGLKEKLLKIDLERFSGKIEKEMFDNGVIPVTFLSDTYPEKLKVIDEPPLVLYTKGDTSLLNKKSISIIGTRMPTDYGKIVCEKFTRELSSAGLVTISGLAYGIDSIVAETTISAGGKTIAVLGGGLDLIYPVSNTNLAKRVSENGLLITEYRIGVKPQAFHFIQRNRIVAALGLGTLIIEAGKKSGTMTTARFAIEQSKELFVVPGNIYSKASEGTNNLIDEMPDTFTISPERILYKLKIKKKSQGENAVQVGMGNNFILDALKNGEKSFDELSEITGIKSAELSSELIKMEMFGLVKKGTGNIYYKM